MLAMMSTSCSGRFCPWLARRRVLVGGEGALGVAELLVDGGDRVQQVALVGRLARAPVDLERLEAQLQRLGVVARLDLDEAHEVQRPGLDDRCPAPPGQRAGIEGVPEGGVHGPRHVGERRLAVQRVGLARDVAEGDGQPAGLLCHQRRSLRVLRLQALGDLQHGFDDIGARQLTAQRHEPSSAIKSVTPSAPPPCLSRVAGPTAAVCPGAMLSRGYTAGRRGYRSPPCRPRP